MIFRIFSPLGASWAHFWRVLSHHGIFVRFFSNFQRFFEDFGWILGGFRGDLLIMFSHFLRNCDFAKNSVSPRQER